MTHTIAVWSTQIQYLISLLKKKKAWLFCVILSLRRKTLPLGCCCWENVHLLSILWYQIGASWCPPFGDVEAQSLAKCHGMCLCLGVQLLYESGGYWPCWLWPETNPTIWVIFPARSSMDFEGWTNFKSHKSSLLTQLTESRTNCQGSKILSTCFHCTSRDVINTSSPLAHFQCRGSLFFTPFIELVLMPPTPRNMQTHIPPEQK